MKNKEVKSVPEKPARGRREIALRVSEEIWQKIQAEMRLKEIEKPQPVIIAALRKRYGLEIA